MILTRSAVIRSSTTLAGIAIAWLPLVGCSDNPDEVSQTEQAVGTPSVDQVPLDPTTVPKFVNQLTIPRTWAPTVIRNSAGAVIRNEYTITAAQTTAQILPPGFPATTVLAYGGQAIIPGSSATEFVRMTPGPKFENTRGIPTIIHWRNGVTGRHFMPVDPTLLWANPNKIEAPPVPDQGFFDPFPTEDLGGQSPVPMVTHNHGLVVIPQNDGIADEWFTSGSARGAGFFTQDYFEPNQQPSTALFYHDHVMGMTRLNVYAGLAGTAYVIRDPNNPLDQANSPLPKGDFEIPLVLQDKAFFTDGEMAFNREGANFKNAYWVPADDSDTVLVNGKAWPNLNVQRRQYRLRLLAAGNNRVFFIAFDNAGANVPFTIIGSDGGFLPTPKTVTSTELATTERSDILIDFGQFPAGTKIIMRNDDPNPDEFDTLRQVMQFTVVNSTRVTPPATPPLVARATLPTNAPRRIKTLHVHFDADDDQNRSVDGLDFTAPTTEFPLIGSTEEWDFVNLGGGEHFIHIHLLEFQVIERQAIDVDAYLLQWDLLNGRLPVTRPIVVDPTPFLIGPPIPVMPYETGWKDTARAHRGEIMRLVTRWAPQETATGGVSPGTNQYPVAAVEPGTNAHYLWHCHVLGHEDNDMMRKMPMVNLWRTNTAYTVGTVVALNNINFRARVAHTSSSTQNTTRFDLWERVNNNDGSWQPQIIYAVGDRVTFQGRLFRARTVHQAQTTPTPNNDPQRWRQLPTQACPQLSTLCANNPDPTAADCKALGDANVDADCADGFDVCLSFCDANNGSSPCSGLCNNPTSFTVPDGTVARSSALGTGASCFETTSEIITGSCQGLGTGRTLTLNGKVQPCNGQNWAQPLTGERHFGYCIQVSAGNGANATFQVQ